MKKKNQNKKKHTVQITTGIVLFVLAVVYLAFGIYFKSHFLFRTTINGLDSSGQSISQVEDEISDEIDSYVLTLEERDGKSETINGKDISIAPQFDGSLEELLKEQNAFGWIVSVFREQEYSIETMVSYDEEKLADALAKLECMDEENQVSPVNAQISDYSETEGYTIVPAEYGSTVNTEVFSEKVKNAVANLDEKLSMEETGCYIDPEITESTQSIVDAAEKLNRYVNARITYDFGDKTEVVDASVIKDWLSVSDNMEVMIDADKAASYIKELASSYNTAGREKTLKMTNGGTVTVPGGSYGWKIDQSAEKEKLLADIESGEIVEREPEYSQRANSHGENDYGNTYVEINLTTQHLYFYKEGALVVSTDFVSGKVAEGNDTRIGAFFINSKVTERTLKGPDYESFVNYWMPFNGDVGMHDATWRSSFGGQIYLRSGSHGCINLPLSAAKTIFANIEVGDPVLVFQTEPTPDVTITVSPETIITEIDSIGPVTLESATIMATIRNQYNALSEEDKAKVTNYGIFTADEATLAELQAAQPQ